MITIKLLDRGYRSVWHCIVLIVFFSMARFGYAENRAYDVPAKTVHPELTRLSKTFEQKLYKLSENAYLAVGYGVANVGMIIGDNGIVIIDTAEDVETGEKILAAFRTVTDKPIAAIVFTHSHIDHFGGVGAFASPNDIKTGKVQIIAHRSFLNETQKTPGLLGNIVGQATKYWVGAYLEMGPTGLVNFGCCPPLSQGTRSFAVPTMTFDDQLKTNIAGIDLEFIFVPSEARDEIAVWFQKDKVMFTADVLSGGSFPNLDTLRGDMFRDPVMWYRSVDRMRAYHAKVIALGHGRPEYGSERVETVLTNFRDAIEFVIDQSFRYMNKGYDPDEMVEVIKLPSHLAEDPWLQQFYGTVVASVRGMYRGHIGWFDGDPWKLDPPPLKERASNYVMLMGGRERVLAAAQRAYSEEKFTWAAELLSYLIIIDHKDMAARHLKADALEQWSFKQINAPWRNWGLSSAKELRGEIGTRGDKAAQLWVNSGGLTALYKNTPKILSDLKIRLRAEDCADFHQTLALAIRDTGEHYALEIRRGVVEIHDQIPSRAELSVELDQRALIRLALREESTASIFNDEKIIINGGTEEQINKFFSYFEPRPSGFPPLALPALLN